MARHWYLRCTTCGKTGPCPGVRIGATSNTKSILVRCTGCRALRWAKVIHERDLQSPTGAGDELWTELLAYVSEGSMSAETAEAIVNSDASTARQRAVAAQIAEGAISATDAVRLLALPATNRP